jgi:hypothetical protein
MKRLFVWGAAIALGISSSTFAQQQTESVEPAAPESKGGFAIDVTVTFPTSYVFRGYVIEEDHFLVQPEITLYYGIPVGDSILWPYIGAWMNLTDAPAPGDPEWFNEIDAYVGFEYEFGEFTLEGIYTWYTSPADFFDDVHEVGLQLRHSHFLQPSAAIYYEICNKSGEENTYIELGLKPKLEPPPIQPLKLEFPLVLGLTPDEYYTDDDGDGQICGYASGGITATWALSEDWLLEAGVDYIHMLADSTEESNDGDESQVVGRFAVKFAH